MTPAASLVASIVETAINRYLRLDADAAARLAELDDNVIALEIRGLEITLYILPVDNAVQVLADYEGEADAVISGGPMALARLGMSKDKSRQFADGSIEISGDTALGTSFSVILGSVEIDWEELVSKAMGDTAAHQFGNFIRGVKSWMGHARSSLRMDLSEYLQEEARLMPTRFEVEQFMDEADALRDDVERLQARFERVKRKMGVVGEN